MMRKLLPAQQGSGLLQAAMMYVHDLSLQASDSPTGDKVIFTPADHDWL